MSSPFPETAPDFSDPLGLLLACHGRMREHAGLLERLAEHLPEQGGVDAEARRAARSVHTYFSTAAPLHHLDEERELFPRLVRTSLKMAETIHRLREDHQALDRQWQSLAPALRQPGTIEDLAAFQRQAREFAEALREHLAYEEENFLELARHLLSSRELKEIGRAMQERRQPQEPSMEEYLRV